MVQLRKDNLINGEYYHIYSRSIAKYVIFNNDSEYSRMVELLDIIRFIGFNYSFSEFKALKIRNQISIKNILAKTNSKWIDIIAYSIMPTHIHLILKQNVNKGISKYMSKVLNSYSKYFNRIHMRFGPLWSGRFKSVRIESDEQMLHLTRYIHLNPSSANLVKNPISWKFSSYQEYLYDIVNSKNKICDFSQIISIQARDYKKFVNDRIDFQKKISYIKSLIIENYTG